MPWGNGNNSPMAPDPVSLAGAATSFGMNALNAVLTGKSNRKNRKFAEKMMNTQRSWALEDWERQNAYNSPKSQMDRFSEAGLNKHLIYGQSNEAPAVRSSNAANWEGTPPQLDPQGTIHAYNETALAQATINNAKLQGEVLAAEKLNKEAQTVDTLAAAKQKGVNTDRQLFDLGVESELRPYSLEYRKGQNRQQDANTTYTLDNNERQKLLSAQTLTKGIAEILNLRAQNSKIDAERRSIEHTIRNLHLDESLKADELRLRALDLTPSSPIYQKKAAEILERLRPYYNKAKSWRDNWWKSK